MKNKDSYEKYLGIFLSKIPPILQKGAIEFFKSTYNTIENCESEEAIMFEIQKKQILYTFSQLNNILNEQILFSIKKDKGDMWCISNFDQLCRVACSNLNYKDKEACDKIIADFNDYCNSNKFKNLYGKIKKYINDSSNFEKYDETPFYE